MLSDSHQRGFTLIELLVGLTIAAVLLGLGAPSLGRYLQNAKLGSAAQSLHAGLSVARAEAIRTNGAVDFIMTNSSVSASGVENSVVPDAAGVNWLVRVPNSGGTYDLVESKASGESEAQPGAAAIQIAVSASAAFGGTITFNGLGGTSDGLAYIFDVTNPGAGDCAAAGGPMRCRRVRVSAGGQMFSCDPAVTDAADNRFCR